MTYGDVKTIPDSAWMLINGDHIGVGQLLELTDDVESLPVLRQYPDKDSLDLDEKKTKENEDGNRPPPRAIVDMPGKTTCLFCGIRANTALEKQAHVRDAGHEGFYI